MIRRKVILTIISVSFIIFSINAQDAVFSQFYAAPLSLNPALTGSFDGTYRVSANYRDQWRSVINDPLSTYAASGEVQFQRLNANNNPDLIGAGLLFYSDRVGTFDLNTTQISLFGSFHKALSKKNNSYLGAGLQIGIQQRNINYEDLQFGDEFNGLDSYSLATKENLPANNFGVGDISLGIHYAVSPNKDTRLFAGVAVFHLTSPNISYYRKPDIPNPPFETENKLERRFTAYISSSFTMTPAIKILPRIFYTKQGAHQTVSLGSNLRYELLKSENRAFHFGTWGRLADSVDGKGLESLILMTGIEFNGLVIGLSYDMNISDLINENQGQGTFELSLNYTGLHENTSYVCPEF
ncbi:MAG: PorP/SprF family type IX secretion system membrane protein [Bacteroidia bacterium]|nr:PorP/SprF family type IX secretion system membrane protein [Bacteroidia bacterium]